MAKFDDDVEKNLLSQVSDGEVGVAMSNQESENDEFEECIDMLEPDRRQKGYDWQSDIHIPEFASHVFTQSSMDVGQYFQTRDFVEVYLQDESEEAVGPAEIPLPVVVARTLGKGRVQQAAHFGAFSQPAGNFQAASFLMRQTNGQGPHAAQCQPDVFRAGLQARLEGCLGGIVGSDFRHVMTAGRRR